MTTVSQQLAEWACDLTLSDVPDDVVEDAKLRVLDTFGCALAAMNSDVAMAVRDAALRWEGGGGNSRALGYGDLFPAATAALINGTLAHSLDFDDTHLEGNNHVSSPAVSAAAAMGDAMDASGPDFLLSVIIGREASCRIGIVTPGTLVDQGFHPTSLIGTLSNALLASRLVGADRDQCVNAMGIAGSQAAGILQAVKDGTWTKRLQPGWAAHSGVWAAMLAQHGVTGPAEIIEGDYGVFRTHAPAAQGAYDFERVGRDLGDVWQSRTVHYKPYPCGQVIHPFIDAALKLREDHGISPAEIRRVRCPILRDFVPIVCEPSDNKVRPQSGYHAKFSLYYAVAVALSAGEVTAAAYDDSAIKNEAVLDLSERVSYEIDETAPGLTERRGWVLVETTDGVYETVVDDPLGTASNPFTPDHVRAKFGRNVAGCGLSADVDELYDSIAGLEKADGFGAVLEKFLAR